MIEQFHFGAMWTSKHERAFLAFHEKNPHVYAALCRLAREWMTRTGRTTLGIAMLFERARWDLALETKGDEFRLNNNYRAYYARLIMKREKDLDGIFLLRQQG